MAVALAVALFLNRRIPGVRALRTVFFLPHVTSFVAIAIVWEWMYHPDFGILNYALDLVGVPKLAWLAPPQTALLAIMLVAAWMTVGYQMVVFLAGLQAIPPELYESAMLNGASAWQRFRHITFPLLWPTTFFILVTSVIWSFQIFPAVYVMTEGGPLGSTDVIVFHIYRSAWQYLEMGYASAMSWVLFALLIPVTWLQFRYLGRRVEYG